MASVLIADDEPNLRKVLAALLEQDGHKTLVASDGVQAFDAVHTQDVDVLITDLRMPEMDGLALLGAVQRDKPGLPVIVITAHGTVETAVSALKMGAVDYITKPFDKDELKLAVRKALSARAKAPAQVTPRGRPSIIGQSAKMRAVFAVIDKVAATPSTVLITGESGTGKELVATALHENSDRRSQALIKVNCGAIPSDLMESEFFGHEKGAFTGAVNAKPGRFELADGGSLFLDEIAEIPLPMQVKLLRALQEGEFERVGGVKTLRVDVRLMAATNRDLRKEVEAGRFREDLFYRLNVVPIALPALRERPDDIPALVRAFIGKANERLGKQTADIAPAALELLLRYNWPGNVRELENVIERASVFAEGTLLAVGDLPEELRDEAATQAAPVAAVTEPTNGSLRSVVRQATQHIERDLIVRALEETKGNVTRAAAVLGISRKGLQNKMKEFDLREKPEA